MLERGSIGQRLLAVAAIAVLAVTASCGDDDDAADDTLSPIAGGTAATPPLAGTAASPAVTGGTGVDPAAAGSGYVTVNVQVAATGLSETVTLDRASVRSDQLDPVSLNATCTPLDGGDITQGLDVSVVDLRRLSAGNRVLSVALHVAGDASAGEHDAALEVSTADQVTTTYTGTVDIADGGLSGTFDAADAAGNAATGTFACAAAPIPTTVSPTVIDESEEVPATAQP